MRPIRTLRAKRLPAAPSLLESPPRRARPLPAEGGLDERVEVAVEHAVDVAGLVLGAQVLHELVRRQYVAADLAAEADLLLLALDGRELVLALLALEVGETGLEGFHGAVTVLELAALDL